MPHSRMSPSGHVVISAEKLVAATHSIADMGLAD
jgi:hypothetical protein